MIKRSMSITVVLFNPITSRYIHKQVYSYHHHDSDQSHEAFVDEAKDTMARFREANPQFSYELHGTVTTVESI